MARILVVDDDASVRVGYHNLFRSYRHEVTAVESAEGALQLLAGGGVYDLIVSDLNMPGMSGTDLLRLLRKSPSTSHQRFVLNTNEDNSDILAICQQYNAHFFIKGSPNLGDFVEEVLKK